MSRGTASAETVQTPSSVRQPPNVALLLPSELRLRLRRNGDTSLQQNLGVGSNEHHPKESRYVDVACRQLLPHSSALRVEQCTASGADDHLRRARGWRLLDPLPWAGPTHRAPTFAAYLRRCSVSRAARIARRSAVPRCIMAGPSPCTSSSSLGLSRTLTGSLPLGRSDVAPIAGTPNTHAGCDRHHC